MGRTKKIIKMSVKYINTKNRTVISVELRTRKGKHTKKSSDNYFEFHKNLYEVITDKPYGWIQKHYMSYGQEAINEEYHADYGIAVMRSWDRFLHIFIPKTEEGDKVVDYILNQKFLKSRILKRAGWYDQEPTTFFRDSAKRLKDKFIESIGEEKFNEIYGE